MATLLRRIWATPLKFLFAGMMMVADPVAAADFYWSGNGASSDTIDQNDNWRVGNAHPSAGDDLCFDGPAGSRHSPTSNYGAGSWFGNLITFSGAGGIKWRGDATSALKFENSSDASLFEIEASISNRPGQDLEINPIGAGGIKVDNSVIITDGRQIRVSGANTLTFLGPISGSSASLAILSGAKVVLGGSTNNTYSGLTSINAGTLSLGKTIGTVGTNAFGGDLTINGGTVNYVSGAVYSNQIPDSANVTVNIGATLDFGAHNETIGQTSPSPAGSLVVNGGTVTMGSAKLTLARNPTISGGVVFVNGFSAILEADQELVFGGGTVDLLWKFGGPRLNLRGGDGTGITYPSSGTTAALIANGGGRGGLSLNINATTVFNVADLPAVATELQIDVPMSNAGTSSAIRKEGAGKLLLTGANVYSGATAINAGELTGATGGSCANSAVSVFAGATNGVRVDSAGGYWSCASLTYNSGTTYADFEFLGGVAPSTNSAPLRITGNLVNNGTVQAVVRNGSPWEAGKSYPLMSWSGTEPADLLKFSKPILPAGVVGNLSLAGKQINLNIGMYAPNLSYTIAPHIGLRIALSNISAQFQSSQSSPSYTFTGVSATSAQGGSVVCDASNLLYTFPASGSPAADSFNYTVSDGRSSATATVVLTFTNAVGGPSGSITVSDGRANVKLYGIPGLQYDVQRSPDLSSWTTLASPPLEAAPPFTAAVDGTITFTDAGAPGTSAFYRTIQH